MNNQDLINLLDSVPEKKLALFQVAQEVTLPDSSIDVEQAERRQQEIEDANEEANHYIKQTARLTEAIKCKFNPPQN